MRQIGPCDKEEVRRDLGGLMQLRIVRDQLEDREATWLVRPKGTELDLGFVGKGAEEESFIGLDLFGSPSCVGVKVCADETSRQKAQEQLLQDPILANLEKQEAKFAVVTAAELRTWFEYYSEIEEQGFLETLGMKALTLSGLRRATEKDQNDCRAGLQALLGEAWGELGALGVQEIAAKGGFDVAFLDERERLIGVEIYNVRQGELKEGSQILLERIADKPMVCPGMVIRKAGENKRQLYERAEELRREYQGVFDRDMVVPVVSPGQISAWRKMGFLSYYRPIIKEADVLPVELIRFLYLGQGNAYPGELARMGLSLPGTGREFGLDVIFYQRRERKRNSVLVDGLIGMNLSALRRGKFKLEVTRNVGGILIVPDHWSPQDMTEYLKGEKPLIDYQRRMGERGAQILLMTRKLLNEWIRQGKALADDKFYVEYNGNSNNVGFGMSDDQPWELTVFRRQPEIGGVKYLVAGKNEVAVGDWGTSFHDLKGLSGLADQPSTAVGLRRGLQTGQYPMVPNLYAIEYLKETVASFPGALCEGNADPVASFVRAELARRVGFSELANLLGKEKAARLMELGQRDLEKWGETGADARGAIFVSHGHADHSWEIGSLRHDWPLAARTPTIAYLRAFSARTQVRKRIEGTSKVTAAKQGRAFLKDPREIFPIHSSNERLRIGSVVVEMPLVDHSIVGAAMVGLNLGGGLVYSGDLKMGDKTRKAVEMMAGRFDTIMMETTKLEEGNGVITEKMVRDTLLKIIGDSETKGKTVIVIAPGNHLERLTSILTAAERTGRRVAVGDKQAEMIYQLRAVRLLAPADVEGFDFPLPKLGEELSLWQKPAAKLKAYQLRLWRLASRGSLGVLNSERLTKEGGDWIVVVSPFDKLQDHFGGAFFREGLVVIFSSPFPYEQQAKYSMGANYRWVQEVIRRDGGRYYADVDIKGQGGRVRGEVKWGLHASGHVSLDEALDEVLFPLLGGQYRGKKIVLIHGEHPVNYEREIRERLGLDRQSELEIFSRLTRYDPRRPLRGGFRLRI